jgi:hypothetical protein
VNQDLIKSLQFKKFKRVRIKDPDMDMTLDAPDQIKPGDVLHMKDGEYLLVGNVNRHLGVCDDCTNYELKDIKEIATLPGF